ncbi:MAG: thiosulfate oxidation carrier complex protein SoxZ [Magnetococcales bacterium]|nr:thiosulfate oxidation carrier complex protein SoxZ [Magnetococcales bacterium]
MADIGEPKVKVPSAPAKAGDIVQIKTLINHPMESGMRKDDKGEVIPAHFIEEVTVEYDGKTVLKGKWTAAISKNPFFSFSLKASKTGPVKVSWKDNKGGNFTASADLTVG